MNTSRWPRLILSAIAASLALAGFAHAAPSDFLVTTQQGAAPTPLAVPTSIATAADTNAPDPEAAVQELENASAEVVSAPEPSAERFAADSPVAEIIKLTQAGVDESVLLAYVTNSTGLFNLSADDIVYLTDIGVPDAVVTAMIENDRVLKTKIPALANQPAERAVNAPGAPTPYAQPSNVVEEQLPQPAAAVVQALPPSANVSYTYFYDSLSPYGTWINVAGYGLCWQPTAVVINRSWQPYCDRGRWVYSDYGWYWVSDYSWGWAPFHYGRWFRHARYGWCWAPDTVWGPSWVSWRYSGDYCGWAPLPPTACYAPGFGFTYYGRSVGVSFSFGIRPDCYAFVPVRRFCDPHPRRHRLPRERVTHVYNSTVVNNNIIRGRNNRIINHGVPVDRIASVSEREVPRVRIRESSDAPRGSRRERMEQGGGTLAVFRPNLPEPDANVRVRRVGENVRADLRDREHSWSRFRRSGDSPAVNPQGPRSTSALEPRRSVQPRTHTGDATAVAGDNNESSRRRSIILRGRDQSGGNETADNTPPRSIVLRGQRNNSNVQNSQGAAPSAPSEAVPPRADTGSRPRVFQRPQSPSPDAVRNDSGTVNTRRFTMPAPQAAPSAPAQAETPRSSPRVYRQEQPQQYQRNDRVYTPAAPVQRTAPVQQWNLPGQPREQRQWQAPASTPSYRQQQQEVRQQLQQRYETRQAPQQQSQQQPQYNAPQVNRSYNSEAVRSYRSENSRSDGGRSEGSRGGGNRGRDR